MVAVVVIHGDVCCSSVVVGVTIVVVVDVDVWMLSLFIGLSAVAYVVAIIVGVVDDGMHCIAVGVAWCVVVIR